MQNVYLLYKDVLGVIYHWLEHRKNLQCGKRIVKEIPNYFANPADLQLISFSSFETWAKCLWNFFTRELEISLRFFSFSDEGGVVVAVIAFDVDGDALDVAAAAPAACWTAVAAAVEYSCLAVLLPLLPALRRDGLMLRTLDEESTACRGFNDGEELWLSLSDLEKIESNVSELLRRQVFWVLSSTEFWKLKNLF